MSRLMPFVLLLAACGSDAEDKEVEVTPETVAETTFEIEDQDVDVIETIDVEVTPETVNTDVDDTRSEAIGDADVPADRLLAFDFGNQVLRSKLTISVLGVTERAEFACCPPAESPADAADLSTSQVAGLLADIEAIAAADATTSQELGTFPDGSSVGSLVVYRGGRIYTVMGYEERDGQRVRVKSIANDARLRLLTLVNGMIDVDLTE